MYNDYYLQDISNKLSITNDRLDSILDNQQLLISGDRYIESSVNNNTNYLLGSTIYLLIVLFAILFYRLF